MRTRDWQRRCEAQLGHRRSEWRVSLRTRVACFIRQGGPPTRTSGQLREQKRYYKRSLGERSHERVTVKKRSCHFKLQTCSPKPTQKEVYRTKQVGNSNKKGQRAPAVVANGDYQERHKASKAQETQAIEEEGRQTKDARCLRKRRARR